MLPFSGTLDDHDDGGDDDGRTPESRLELAGAFLVAFVCCLLATFVRAKIKR